MGLIFPYVSILSTVLLTHIIAILSSVSGLTITDTATRRKAVTLAFVLNALADAPFKSSHKYRPWATTWVTVLFNSMFRLGFVQASLKFAISLAFVLGFL